MEEKKAICIYGASISRIDPIYVEQAFETGRLIALSGHTLVCGGGRGGLMAAAIEGALDAEGSAVGVLPQFMIDREWQHPKLTELISTSTMHVRKETMASLSAAVIALPGGIGTLEELLEIITWRQLRLYDGNVVILNTNGYYNPLLQMLEKCSSEGFMRPGNHRLFEVATNPQEAINLAIRHA